MKWLIGPRRIRKTTTLVEAVVKMDASEVAFVTRHRALCKAAHRTMVEYLKRENIDHKDSDGKIHVFGGTKWKTVVFISIDTLMKYPSPYTGCLKVIDDADAILEYLFTNVKYVSATGPNYRWPQTISELCGKDELDHARQEMGDFAFAEEFAHEWEFDEC